MCTVEFRMPGKVANTSLDKRQLVIFHHEAGKSVKEITSTLQMSRATVYRIITRFQKEDRIDFIKPSGRPAKLSATDQRFIVRSVAKNPKISAPKIATQLCASSGTTISAQTVRRVLKNKGYNSRTARSKPFISSVNQKKRLEFALKYINEADNYWNDVLFSDESKFNLFGSDGKQKVWRKPNTELEKKNLNVTIKHGGGSVLVWGCFAASGVGSLVFIEGIMTADSYIEILRQNLHSSAEKLNIRKTFKYYQDNDPKHKAHKTREWLLYNCPRVLQTPPQSPDLNPIENLWDYLDRAIRTTPITSRAHLKQRLQEEWDRIPVSYLQKLVASEPQRLRAVIQAKGLHTKY